jgi:hypothetical protein
MAKDATVIQWNSDFTYETLKKGTSRMVCYDLTGWPGERPWSVECTSSEARLRRRRGERVQVSHGVAAKPAVYGAVYAQRHIPDAGGRSGVL